MTFHFCGLPLRGNVFLAPMAGITTRPFRIIARSLGCHLAWTEMISAEGLVRKDPKTADYLPRKEEGGAVVVQLFGHRPEALRDAALIAEETPAGIIDINMGCPVRKVVKDGGGAALMRRPERVRKILEAVCRSVGKPVTVKMRAGWDESSRNAVEIAKIARDCGVAAVTVHGRTARQGFSGKADWGIVGEVARESGITVVGSGDLAVPRDVEEALGRTGCAAVMIGRAALGRPWIFRETEEAGKGKSPSRPAPDEVSRIMHRHLELNIEEFGERRGVLLTRRPLAWYSRGLPGATEFRRRVNARESGREVQQEIEAFVGPAFRQ